VHQGNGFRASAVPVAADDLADAGRRESSGHSGVAVGLARRYQLDDQVVSFRVPRLRLLGGALQFVREVGAPLLGASDRVGRRGRGAQNLAPPLRGSGACAPRRRPGGLPLGSQVDGTCPTRDAAVDIAKRSALVPAAARRAGEGSDSAVAAGTQPSPMHRIVRIKASNHKISADHWPMIGHCGRFIAFGLGMMRTSCAVTSADRITGKDTGPEPGSMSARVPPLRGGAEGRSGSRFAIGATAAGSGRVRAADAGTGTPWTIRQATPLCDWRLIHCQYL